MGVNCFYTYHENVKHNKYMICNNVEKARRRHMGNQNLAIISGLDEHRVHKVSSNRFSSKWTIEIRMSSKKP